MLYLSVYQLFHIKGVKRGRENIVVSLPNTKFHKLFWKYFVIKVSSYLIDLFAKSDSFTHSSSDESKPSHEIRTLFPFFFFILYG